MSSLFGTMSVALQSLLVQQGALEVTANNIANANTPGFKSSTVVFSPQFYVTSSGASVRPSLTATTSPATGA